MSAFPTCRFCRAAAGRLPSRERGRHGRLRDDGTPVLDYPLTLMLGRRAARIATMAEIQFAAGARRDARPGEGRSYTMGRAEPASTASRSQPLATTVVSAPT